MQGNTAVVACLKELLRGELSARDQYFIHSRRYGHLGLGKLYERLDHEMQEETQHADALLKRIFFLDGEPDMRPLPFTPGQDVEDMLQKDLATEYKVRGDLQAAIASATTSPATSCCRSCATPRKTTPTGSSSSSA